MGATNYSCVIDDMTWSWSRIKTFEDCQYRWYLKYLYGAESQRQFFSDYGKFVHEIFAFYLKGVITPEEAKKLYLTRFSDNISVSLVPNTKVLVNYFRDGLDAMDRLGGQNFTPLAVEKKVNFRIGNRRFVGFIDLIGRDDTGVLLIDHKSRKLKPRSHRDKPTASDAELDDYLRQLYIYAAAYEQESGHFPDWLCFNCFRSGEFIREPFDVSAYKSAVEYAESSIESIRKTEEFAPSVEYFKCRYLCDVNDQCEYYELFRG